MSADKWKFQTDETQAQELKTKDGQTFKAYPGTFLYQLLTNMQLIAAGRENHERNRS